MEQQTTDDHIDERLREEVKRYRKSGLKEYNVDSRENQHKH